MKLIEFKAELITRWYEIAPFSEISICEDDRYGGLLKNGFAEGRYVAMILYLVTVNFQTQNIMRWILY